jgi:hypothetical protein
MEYTPKDKTPASKLEGEFHIPRAPPYLFPSQKEENSGEILFVI